MPKRVRTKKPEPPRDATGDPLCYCGRARASGSDYCKAHTVHDLISGSAKKAYEKGNLLEAAAYAAASWLLDENKRKELAAQYMMFRQMRQQQAAQAAAQKRAAKPDPFRVLHLDPKTATIEDVKRVQKQLAAVFHADKGESGVASEAMAEINAAAQAAIEAIVHREGRF